MAQKLTLSDILAKELGYKDGKELKRKISERGGQDFSSNVKGRLESGQGFSQSFSESYQDIGKDIQEKFSKGSAKRFGRKAYMSLFSGDDIFNAYMRGLINKKRVQNVEQKVEESKAEEEKVDQETNVYLEIIAKNSLSMPGIARDMNVLRQNMIKLVKIESEKYNADKNKKQRISPINRADAFFLKEDEREAKLESERQKLSYKPKETKAVTQEKKEEGGGSLIDKIFGFLSKGLNEAISFIFNPKKILPLLLKAFAIGTLLKGLFDGIVSAFQTWKETGSLLESLKGGIGSLVEALTFGFFKKGQVGELIDNIVDGVLSFIDNLKITFYKLKDWVTNNVGIPEIKLGSITAPSWIPKIGGKTFEIPPIGPWYPFKSNPKSTEKQVTTVETSESRKPKGSVEPAPAAASATQASTTGTTTQATTSPTPVSTPKQTDDLKTYEELKVSLENSKMDFKKEKAQAISLLNSDTNRFPNGINLDPGSPDYPEELKSIDKKYELEITNKIKDIRKLESSPSLKGVKKVDDFNIKDLFTPQRVGVTGTPTTNQTAGGTPGAPISASTPISPTAASAPSATPATTPSPTAAASSATEGSAPATTPSPVSPTTSAEIPTAPSPTPSGASIGGSFTENAVSSETPSSGGTSGPLNMPATPISEQGSKLEPTLSPSASNLGQSLSSQSSSLAEEQRMEGKESEIIVNAPTNNVNNSTASKSKAKPSDVYDVDFLQTYSLA
jgi:hypothetical protein